MGMKYQGAYRLASFVTIRTARTLFVCGTTVGYLRRWTFNEVGDHLQPSSGGMSNPKSTD